MIDDSQLFELYFQKGKEYYLERLDRYHSGKKFTFNVFAFLFGLFWFVYRKMYLQALIILIAAIGEGFIEQEILKASVGENAGRIISIITTIAIATITGFVGNNLYIRQAEKTISIAKAKSNDEEELQNVLKRKGGVSYAFFIFLVIAIILFFVYNNYLGENGS